MKKITVRLALIGVFFVLPLVAFVWILNNATLFSLGWHLMENVDFMQPVQR